MPDGATLTAVARVEAILRARCAGSVRGSYLELAQTMVGETLAHAEPVHVDCPAPHAHPADLDAYQVALTRLVDAVDRYGVGALHAKVAHATCDARELLTQDQAAADV